MPRPLRLALGGGCYHVINRGNGRAFVFRIEADFLAFERVLPLACERISVRLLACALASLRRRLACWMRWIWRR